MVDLHLDRAESLSEQISEQSNNPDFDYSLASTMAIEQIDVLLACLLENTITLRASENLRVEVEQSVGKAQRGSFGRRYVREGSDQYR